MQCSLLKADGEHESIYINDAVLRRPVVQIGEHVKSYGVTRTLQGSEISVYNIDANIIACRDLVGMCVNDSSIIQITLCENNSANESVRKVLLDLLTKEWQEQLVITANADNINLHVPVDKLMETVHRYEKEYDKYVIDSSTSKVTFTRKLNILQRGDGV